MCGYPSYLGGGVGYHAVGRCRYEHRKHCYLDGTVYFNPHLVEQKNNHCYVRVYWNQDRQGNSQRMTRFKNQSKPSWSRRMLTSPSSSLNGKSVQLIALNVESSRIGVGVKVMYFGVLVVAGPSLCLPVAAEQERLPCMENAFPEARREPPPLSYPLTSCSVVSAGYRPRSRTGNMFAPSSPDVRRRSTYYHRC